MSGFRRGEPWQPGDMRFVKPTYASFVAAAIVAVLLVLLLSACGGGGGSGY